MTSHLDNLIVAWKAFHTSQAPYVLEEDRPVLDQWDKKRSRKPSSSAYHPAQNWADYTNAPDFGAPHDSRLHTGLLPMPFMGNLSEAKIFILMLNPGVGPHDYFGEYKVPEYREALLANLRQDAHPDGFLFLDPKFSWHGGYRYWHSKLRTLIDEFSKRRRIPYGEARRTVQKAIAAIELVPYHSEHFAVPSSVTRDLRSAQLARSFAMELAARSDCLVVVTRQSREWNLNGIGPTENVVEYSASEARAAYLTPDSPGGRRILRFLEQA